MKNVGCRVLAQYKGNMHFVANSKFALRFVVMESAFTHSWIIDDAFRHKP